MPWDHISLAINCHEQMSLSHHKVNQITLSCPNKLPKYVLYPYPIHYCYSLMKAGRLAELEYLIGCACVILTSATWWVAQPEKWMQLETDDILYGVLYRI